MTSERAESAFSPTAVLVTGAAGFIGSNLVRWILEKEPNVRVVAYDALTYAGNVESLRDVDERFGSGGDGRYHFVRGDVCDGARLRQTLAGDMHETTPHGPGRRVPTCDAVMHLAAESHVDRSILGPAVFVETNVRGTLALLEAIRAHRAAGTEARLLHVSTDEVYGSLGPSDPAFTERTPLAPNSPYAASKAGSDMLVRAYVETFGLPAAITRCSNNYGPYQFPEKLIPLMVTRALRDEPLPVYGDGRNIRDWLHVEDHVAALWTVLVRGRPTEVYNIGGESERTNLDVVRGILDALGKPHDLIRFVPDRLGHDRRYAMDITRIRRELSWAPRWSFEEGLRATVDWYVANEPWWTRVLSEAYRAASELYLG